MSLNFSDLLNEKTGDVVAPPPLPVGKYEGILGNFSIGESSLKSTPFVEFAIVITGATPDVDPAEFEAYGGMAALQNREVKVQYYLTSKAKFMLADMLRSLGLPEDKTLEENLNGANGAGVIVTIGHEITDVATFSKVKNVVGSTPPA